MLARLAIGAAVVALAACTPGADDAETPATPAVPAAPEGAVLDTSPEITAADISARVRELSDDKYEGRAPGTVAGEASADWIASELQRAGVAPGNGDSYFQTVEMVAQTVDPTTSSLTINANGETIDLPLGSDSVFITKRQDQETVSFADSEMVFVGYGVVAPEWGWDDYAGLDVAGKTVVMFVNDPGFVTNDDTLFNGEAMTYYGRWTYKYEEAARQGATAALIIHETAPASYGWNVVEGSWTGEQADLVRADAGASRTLLEGWITLDRATELFTAAGLDIDEQRTAANVRGFTPVAMEGLSASATITQTIRTSTSRNVIGTVRGAAAPDEHVLFMAHWDHLGKMANAPAGEDAIYNGAVDNATGVAAILEIAEKMASEAPPARSVTFLAVTLEESGLLGSAYYGENPVIPLAKTVAGVNIDAISPMGLTNDVLVIGAGASELEDMLGDILEAQSRYIRPDPEPQAGYFYRSDHISLAKKGVPMLYMDGGIDAVDGGVARGERVNADYRANDYHAPSDDFREGWDFAGLEQDFGVAYELARRIADSSDWPTWYDGNEFKAIREESLAGQ